MDSSAPSILLPQVQVPSTPSTLFSIYIVQIVYLSIGLECEKNENKQKEAVIGPLFLKKRIKFNTRGTAIAQRIRVSLPFCRPESGLSMLSSIIVNFFRTKKRPGLANYKSLSHGSVDPSAAVILWPLV